MVHKEGRGRWDGRVDFEVVFKCSNQASGIAIMTCCEDDGGTKFFGSFGPWNIENGGMRTITQDMEKDSKNKVRKEGLILIKH